MKIEEEKEGLGLGVFSLFGEERERDRGEIGRAHV